MRKRRKKREKKEKETYKDKKAIFRSLKKCFLLFLLSFFCHGTAKNSTSKFNIFPKLKNDSLRI